MSNLKNGFHIISFSNSDFSIPLFAATDFSSGAKVSIVIGENGSRKSRAIAAIVDELTSIEAILRGREASGAFVTTDLTRRYISSQQYDLDLEESSKDGHAGRHSNISYYFQGFSWRVERTGDVLKAWKDGLEIELQDLLFPQRAIAVAHLPVDRFKFSTNSPDDFYAYLGLRQSSNMTTTGSIETKLALAYLGMLQDQKQGGVLDQWLQELNLDPPSEIEIGFSRAKLFTVGSFEDFQNLTRSLSRVRLLRSESTRKEKEVQEAEDSKKIWPFVEELLKSQVHKKADGSRTTMIYKVPLDGSGARKPFHIFNLVEMLELGRKLRIFSDVSIIFRKHGVHLPFSDLSSGEQHVLSMVVRVVAELRGAALVVIDEPEVSLHPRWQRKYIHLLLKTLKNFPSTHVVIATHSHFLVSDASTSRVSLTVAEGGKAGKFSEFDGDVYGRSAEDILYRVFGVASVSNFYVEKDLVRALQMISGTQEMNFDEVTQIQGRLSSLPIQGNEALQSIISQIEEFIKSRDM
ncbi:AAA family ATPase [Alloyangia pacifica]|uniref:AAA family ATPase n=1 Tax=Alloyangia pacifica TaxID=311180 RepID=UPI001CD29D1F|nr:AAA family ATPase [Alloyangia pacifica]MCA0997015.1 AAA family ATPase [Alloyangia pacifica]